MGITLASLAAARGLNPETLKRLGWREGTNAICIPWPTTTGGEAWHNRHSIEKDGEQKRWTWTHYDRTTILPYGADRLATMREKHPEAIVIVESETDATALWTCGIPAIATGGADGWQPRWWELLQGFERATLWLEDTGSLPLLRRMLATRPEHGPTLYVCHNLRGPKDPGRILASLNGTGRDVLRQIVGRAVAVQVVNEGELLGAIIERLGARRSGQGFEARCPFHEDRHPSLSIFRGEKCWTFKCHGGSCGMGGPLALLGAALGLAVAEEEAKEFVSSHIELPRDETNIKASSRPLPFAPLAQALAAEPQEPAWLWRGYLVPGCITLMAGRPKSGKTTLYFALLTALAEGDDFLGQPTRPARVVLLTEERPPTLAEKARRWGVGDHVAVLLRHQALGTPWPEVVRQAVEHAEAIGAQVLVVDTFAEWAGLAGDAENSAGAVLEAMQPLQWAAARGLAVLLVVHQRKAQGEHGEAVRGSSALTGAVDIVLELERPAGGVALPPGVRVLRGVGRFEGTPAEVAIELTEKGYQAQGTVPEAEGAAQRQAILDFLATVEEATADQVAEAVGIPRTTAHKRLGELLEAAEVNRSGSGKRGDPFLWSLVPGPGFVSSQGNSICDETNPVTNLDSEGDLAAALGVAATVATPASNGPSPPPDEYIRRTNRTNGRIGDTCPGCGASGYCAACLRWPADDEPPGEAPLCVDCGGPLPPGRRYRCLDCMPGGP